MTDQPAGGGTSNCPTVRNTNTSVSDDTLDAWIRSSAKGDAVVIFSTSTSEMCHTVKMLFGELGVTNSTVYELDEETSQLGKEIERVLMGITGSTTLPVVFIGGVLLGDGNQVIDRYLKQKGKLVKRLKKAGARH